MRDQFCQDEIEKWLRFFAERQGTEGRFLANLWKPLAILTEKTCFQRFRLVDSSWSFTGPPSLMRESRNLKGFFLWPMKSLMIL